MGKLGIKREHKQYLGTEHYDNPGYIVENMHRHSPTKSNVHSEISTRAAGKEWNQACNQSIG